MSAFYIPPLARLVAATKQDHRRVASNCVVDAVPLADVNAHLADALPNGFVVAKVSFFSTFNASGDSCLSALITQVLKPVKEGAAPDYPIILDANVTPCQLSSIRDISQELCV